MNSFMNMVKIQNPEKEYPSNIGKKWSDEEEILLLEELNKNIDIETISQTHNRTIGGINSRRREIAYKMYLKNVSMKEIINQTKLDDECIRQTIERRQNNNSKKITEIKTPISIETKKESQIQKLEFQIQKLEFKNQKLEFQIQKTPNNDFEINITNDIFNIKNELKEIKSSITELKDMLNSIYEFEFIEV